MLPTMEINPKYETYHGFDRKQWESLLGKGSSLMTLKGTDIKSEVPDWREIKEGRELEWSKRLYGKVNLGLFTITQKVADLKKYRGIGKERSVGDNFVGFDSKEKGRAEIDRVLGIFSKRKEEASLRQRAPGRAATMLTTQNKTTLTGY
tara:strand:+ start:2715 stop:3161 length:447 start_codon:yes stop_codon:yes gene_type:complete